MTLLFLWYDDDELVGKVKIFVYVEDWTVFLHD
jgi:hypothetical protein